MYQINEISNRDVSLLYRYRILREPADYLTAACDAGEPIITEIYQGEPTDSATEAGEALYRFTLGIEDKAGYIPYLEFNSDDETDLRHLESIQYYDDLALYGLRDRFNHPVQVKIYWVKSLANIQQALLKYTADLDSLGTESLKAALNEYKSTNKHTAFISGNDSNLLELTGNAELDMQDSGYMIDTALEAQLLVNPSQELLMSLPRQLKHNINIMITDSELRYLSSFCGYSINIRGNGSWILRDLDSTVDFVSGSGSVKLWNCRLVHFRNSITTDSDAAVYTCDYLYAHNSLVVLNQGVISNVSLTGGSTLMAIPTSTGSTANLSLVSVAIVGPGCSLYSWLGKVPVPVTAILGLVWWLDHITSDSALYIAGRRIDEIGGEHDAELNPNRIIEYRANNIHIYQGGV